MGCGGFVAVDEDTGSLSELQWARIPVKCAERSYLILLILLWGRVAILFSYGGSLYLGSRRWCLAGSLCGEGGLRVGEDGGGTSRAVCCGSKREKVEQLRLQLGVQDMSLAGGNPPTLPVEVFDVETDVRGRVGVSVGLVDLGRGSRPINLNGLGGCSEGVTGVGFGPEGIDALGGGLFFGEEPLVTLSRAQSESSISKERCASGDDDSLVRLTSAAMPLEALEVVKRGSMTDEAVRRSF
ncbi:hypothetical protein CK203_108406 [Vitis vinifera]|uniref:Uncharacterized protein n=1 Tax=Vitis vinifera TaxID=29760 RepID=A0A438E2A1_VITVI|nr:hypothetical protein CK203_108406 [Vitis vinifera]